MNPLIAPVAGAVASKILGIGSRQAQEEQQARYQEKQIEGAKELAENQKRIDLEIWNATNYEAQRNHLEAAGLNAGLLYGKGGMGGMTTGSGGGGMPTAGIAEAPSAAVANQQQLAMMAGQMKVMNSQAELNEAQANKANVEATKAAGVDTDAAKQGILSAQAKTALDNANKEIAQFTMKWNDATYSPRIEMLDNQVKQTKAELIQEMAEANIAQETQDEVIRTVQLNMAQKILENTQIGAKTKNIEELTKEIEQNIRNNTLGDWAQKAGIGKDIVHTLRMIFK